MLKTRQSAEKQLALLTAKRRGLEGNETIREWKKFLSFPYAKQIAIRHEWDEYYKKVPETPIYQLFLEQKKALLAQDIARVKDLADQARRMREEGVHITIVLPQSTDPFEFDFGGIVREYRTIEAKIKDLLQRPDMEMTEEANQIFSDR